MKIQKTLAVIAAAAATVVALAGDITGSYKGRVVVDRGQLPRNAQGAEISHQLMELYTKLKFSLILNKDGTFTYTALGEKMSTVTSGTWKRSGQEGTLTVTKRNGKTVKPEDLAMKVSKNEREVQMLGDSKDMVWISFSK